MIITIPRKSLLSLVDRCAPVADQRSAMPALHCIFLEADNGQLTAYASDMYQSIRSTAEATVKEPGSVAIGARSLKERVKGMPEGDVTVSVVGDEATIRSAGARRFTIGCLPGDDYPPRPEVPTDDSFKLPTEALASLIRQTQFSISTDETRAHVNSALIDIHDNTIRMVSTDGHRLSVAEAASEDAMPARQFQVCLKGIVALKGLLADAIKKGPLAFVTVAVRGPMAFFTFEDATFSTKLVEAPFPPYEQVIPKRSTSTVTVDRAALADAFAAISVAVSDKTGGVKMTAATSDSGPVLRLIAESPDTGNGVDEVPAECTGEPVTIGCSAKYVSAALGAVDCESVVIEMQGELDPVVIRPAGEKMPTFVVMPMRLT